MLPKPEGIPRTSGVYIFKSDNAVIYVGKAKNLANRVGNYFVAGESQSRKAIEILNLASSLEWVITANEVDALILENELIKEHQPRFNVRLKDDKSYPYLALDLRHEYPVPYVTRSPRQRGVRYFGPFGHVKSLRRMLDEILQVAPLRTCTSSKFASHTRQGRPCLLFDLKKCSGPCVGAVSGDEYAADVESFTRFFSGRVDEIRTALETQMNEASSERRYEDAARARDGLRALDLASTEQHIVLDDKSDIDLIDVYRDEYRAVVTLIQVRRGRVLGRDSALFELDPDVETASVIETYCVARYKEESRVPDSIVFDGTSDTHQLVHDLVRRVKPSPVKVSAPRGDRQRAILMSAHDEGQSVLRRDSLRRSADHNVRSQALTQIGEALELAAPPFRMECFDMSHLQGTNYVGSMVVMIDGLPAKSSYRHFNVKSVWGNDDAGAMREVLQRRLRYLVEDPVDAKFPRPDLIVIDGGIPQLHAALEAASDIGVSGVEFVALAKREELLYRPNCSEPIRLDRGSEALYLLQRLRDEAHRFAITFHRSKRGSAMVASVLEGIAGLGPTRQARLLETFGSLKAIRALPRERLYQESWLPNSVADALYDQLHPEFQPPLIKREGVFDD